MSSSLDINVSTTFLNIPKELRDKILDFIAGSVREFPQDASNLDHRVSKTKWNTPTICGENDHNRTQTMLLSTANYMPKPWMLSTEFPTNTLTPWML